MASQMSTTAKRESSLLQAWTPAGVDPISSLEQKHIYRLALAAVAAQLGVPYPSMFRALSVSTIIIVWVKEIRLLTDRKVFLQLERRLGRSWSLPNW